MIPLAVYADFFLLFSIVAYVIYCPYTKVEESFNLQAMHDLLEYTGKFANSMDISQYDHNEFPGVVPRTFVGAILVSAIVKPIHEILISFSCEKIVSQYISRIILGFFSWIACVRFRFAVGEKFGERVSHLMILLIGCQFHLPFYMSRTLPNTFALIGCMHSFSFWLLGCPLTALSVMTAVTVIHRCDVLILLLPLTLQILVCREEQFLSVAITGILSGACALLTTVIIDSYFWHRWLWPEGVVLFFNTIENRCVLYMCT